MRTVGSDEGVTLLEVTLMLVVAVTIMAALAPVLSGIVRRAETTAATNAMNNIRDAVLAFSSTDGLNFTISGSQQGSATKVNLLVSDGDIPPEVSASGSTSWQSVVDNTGGLTDFLERHLVMNEPRGSAANAYTTGGGNPWKGGYMSAPIDPDPWGNRYGVNVQYLGGGSGGTNDVVVYSAGPDEEVDSAFTANPLSADDDDLIVLVES